MLSVILTILKVIGIILLIILGIIIILLCIILFVPVRYKASGTFDNDIHANARVTWLLHLVNVSVVYDRLRSPPDEGAQEEPAENKASHLHEEVNGPHITVKVFGKVFYDNLIPKEEREKKKEEKKRRKAEKALKAEKKTEKAKTEAETEQAKAEAKAEKAKADAKTGQPESGKAGTETDKTPENGSDKVITIKIPEPGAKKEEPVLNTEKIPEKPEGSGQKAGAGKAGAQKAKAKKAKKAKKA